MRKAKYSANMYVLYAKAMRKAKYSTLSEGTSVKSNKNVL